ncbi:MAG: YrbL family protein [Parahaliea sp.]
MNAGSHPARVNLGDESNAFARGGNRLCFVDPDNHHRCIKVLRIDRSPEIKRRSAPWIKRFKPLSSFNDNLQEARVFRRIGQQIGAPAFELIPHLHGFVSTNFGEGLCCDLICDDDERISLSLKQYLWQCGRDTAIETALAAFGRQWQQLAMPSRRLLLHNIVVQCQQGQANRLYVIDGLGWPDLLPLANILPALGRHRAGQRLQDLDRAIDTLLTRQAQDGDFGIHGWLPDTRREF